MYSCSPASLLVLWIGIAIAMLVCGLMIYSTASFRSTSSPRPSVYLHNAAIEVAWALIPILILIVTALPAVTTLIGTEAHCSVGGNGLIGGLD